MSPTFELQVDRKAYAPGDAVRGTVLVADGGRSRSLTVKLDYIEKTRDYSAVATSVEIPPLGEGDLTAGQSFEFELRLPPDAYPSYVSEHGELYWELDIKSDERARDTHERARIEVPGDLEEELAYRRADGGGDADSANSLGVLLEERGDLQGAEAAYRRADERGHAVAASNLGALLEERGDREGAEAAYRRGDERGDADSANSLGVLLEERGDLQGAEAAYRRADERGDLDGADNLGRLLEERGDLEGADAAYARAEDREEAGEG